MRNLSKERVCRDNEDNDNDDNDNKDKDNNNGDNDNENNDNKPHPNKLILSLLSVIIESRDIVTRKICHSKQAAGGGGV